MQGITDLAAVCRFAALALLLISCKESEPTSSAQAALQSPISERSASQAPSDAPNILFILADDLGYADLGVFGSEIPTPNIDELANNGLLLTDFYANMTCSPTRAMLFSGTDNHLAGLGVMGAPAREEQRGQPGYEGYLNFRVASLADLMSDAGYNTYMTGKWHLGASEETGPRARGFRRSFVSLDGAAHLGGLSWNGPGLAPYRDGEERVTVDEDFYTTRFYTRRMIEYIEADRDEQRPFFAYLAYTAPHWPLQAPEESIERFAGWYDEGYEALYAQRFQRMQERGLLAADARPAGAEVWTRRWDDLSAQEQRIESRKMEIYAAMVSDLDHYVGEMIDYLKSTDEFDNTFIMFMSDNGAEGLRRDLAPPLRDWVADCCDNSYDNMGEGDSYIMYGPDWATASATPLRRHKATGFEGGIHVPAFVHYPRLIEPGSQSDGFGTVMDVLPTFLALAGAQHPGTSYRGQDVLPVKGRSLLPMLSGQQEEVHPQDEFVGWELYGHRSLRQGDWKIVWDQARGDAARWMLFNLAEDSMEQHDLSAQQPEKLAQMTGLWERYAQQNGVIY